MEEFYYFSSAYEVEEENNKNKLISLGIDPYYIDSYLGIDYYNNLP